MRPKLQPAGGGAPGKGLEVSATVRHHSPGCTMAQNGKRRVEGARKPAAGAAERIGLGRFP